MKRLLPLIIFLCHGAFGMDGIAFKHLGIRDGLSDCQINAITKDSRGFMWFSTSHGLNRYDGYTFKVFTRNSKEPFSLPENGVEEVSEDARGLLWIRLTRHGYVYFDPLKETFHPAGPLLRERYGIDTPPERLYFDKRKNIWSHNYNGTYYYNLEEGKLRFFPISEAETRQGIACCITEDAHGILLLYPNGYVERIDRDGHGITMSDESLTRGLLSMGEWQHIFVDSDGDYWIYGPSGLRVFYPAERRWEELTTQRRSPYILSGDQVKDIKQDGKGRIWIALDHGGIDIIDKSVRSLRVLKNDPFDERSIIQNSINCLYCDETGGVWAGSYKRGVSYYNESIFKFRSDLLSEFNRTPGFSPDVNAIVEDRLANLWVATSSGLVYIDRESNERRLFQQDNHPHSLSGNVIISLLNTKEGELWIGTFRDGLNRYDGRSFTRFRHDPDNPNSLVNDNVWTLAQDLSGTIWIGTLGSGLQGYDPRTGLFSVYAQPGDGFHNEYISSICVGRDQNLYIGTSNGVTFFSPASKSFEKWHGNRRGTQQFSHPEINHVFEDSRGLLWLATAEGLNVYDRKSDEITFPFRGSHLESEVIQAITEDHNKNLWVTTIGSISHIIVHIDPATGHYTFACRRYDETDGLRDQQFNPRSITKTGRGEIIAGGVRGLSLFDPERFSYNSHIPTIVFTELQLFNKEVKIDSCYNRNRVLTRALNRSSAIKLKHSQNVFSVSFSAMNYVLPEKTSYLYMLEGFNSDWMIADGNKLTYTNLTPGKYRLKVKAVNSDGFSSQEDAGLDIIITPPFHVSPIAFLFYFLFIVVILLLARRHILRNERQKYRLAQIEQEARQKHEIDDMKLRFFTNISHELRTPLTLILSPLENVMKQMENPALRNKLEMAHRNATRLLHLVNQLLDFRKSDVKGHQLQLTQGEIVESIRGVCNAFTEYSEKKEIFFTFFTAVEALWMVFDEDKVGKIVMNLLSNAFQYTPEGGRVDLSLDRLPAADSRPAQLEIKVSDSGIGISEEEKEKIFDRFYQIQRAEGIKSGGSGIGLHLVKEFVNLHGGAIAVYDNIGKGSVFIVTLPVIPAGANYPAQPTTTPEGLSYQAPPTVFPNGVSPAPPIITPGVPIGVSTDVPTGNETETEMPTEAGTQAGNSKEPARPLVLIVDDNRDFRLFMRDILSTDYAIQEAADGAKAWAMIPGLQPDIIVSDVMMPLLDGNELCRRVKSDIRTSHIPLILLTARSAKDHKLEGIGSGADDYVTKPFDCDLLSLRIKMLLQKRQKRQENFSRHIEVSPSEITITSLDEKLINKAVRYVEEHISRADLSVEELSAALGMSRAHLYKKLMAITGKSPIEFIRVIRLKRAAQYLLKSGQTINEIVWLTGFNNVKSFRKYFKDEFGMPPNEYQQRGNPGLSL